MPCHSQRLLYLTEETEAERTADVPGADGEPGAGLDALAAP